MRTQKKKKKKKNPKHPPKPFTFHTTQARQSAKQFTQITFTFILFFFTFTFITSYYFYNFMDEDWEIEFELHIQGYIAIKWSSTNSKSFLTNSNKSLCFLTKMLYDIFHIKTGVLFKE